MSVHHDPTRPPQFKIGTRVRAVYPNAKSWGEGVITQRRDEPGLKPYRVRRDDGAVGFFHVDQIEAL